VNRAVIRPFIIGIALLFSAHGASAAAPSLAERAANIAGELRCLVCQNQTIADSSAELAVDLKRQINDQLAEGKTDAEIRDYMVARYGDFVLYRPPLKTTTIALWLGPLILLLLGFWALRHNLRGHHAQPSGVELTAVERERAARLLSGLVHDKETK
jgi:cytochrome c-type biogenesis protein CcmH